MQTNEAVVEREDKSFEDENITIEKEESNEDSEKEG